MSLQTRLIEYGDGDTVFEGQLFWDADSSRPRPGVLVAHTIRGRTDFELRRAEELAALGYVGFAIDVYGKQQIGTGDENGRACMVALKGDRPLLQRRLMMALTTLQLQPEVDEKMIAAIGFCFGGLCVLDLARIAAPVKGVASFHGIFEPPGNTIGNKSDAKILALHGWDDPLATPEEVVGLASELTALGADWQIHGYGGTQHAFTNPAADDSSRGTVYNSNANRRSKQAMVNFLAECFGAEVNK